MDNSNNTNCKYTFTNLNIKFGHISSAGFKVMDTLTKTLFAKKYFNLFTIPGAPQ